MRNGMTDAELKATSWINVLSDNTTYSGLRGCWIAMTWDLDEIRALDTDEISAEEIGRDPQRRVSLQALLWHAIDTGYFRQKGQEPQPPPPETPEDAAKRLRGVPPSPC